MSSADVLKPAPTTGPPKSGGGAGSGTGGHGKAALKQTNSGSKRKNKYDRSGRKRSKSFTGCGSLINHKPVLPSKFLLGGNIKDPLNLGSLQDEEINRAMNAVTPKSSPVPTPPRKKGQIEVIIPKNIHDPLNLIDCDDDADYEQQLCSPVKKNRKKRMKKRRTISGNMETSACAESTGTEAKTPESSSDSAKIPDETTTEVESPEDKVADEPVFVNLEPNITAAEEQKKEKSAEQLQQLPLLPQQQQKKEKNKRKSDEHGPGGGSGTGSGTKKFKNFAMDKIVSPVVPQPGAWLKRANSVTKRPPHRPADGKNEENLKMPAFKDKDKRYQYGNYNRYYGYRNPGNEPDHRLRVFAHHPYLFQNKDILDIGCNIGHITLTIARDFRARSALGIDIDPKLIAIARKNIKHYVKQEASPRGNSVRSTDDGGDTRRSGGACGGCEFFPISMPILYGSVDVPGSLQGLVTDGGSGATAEQKTNRGFPDNVTFKHCNYVLEDESLLANEQPQFDVILCLSVTKWMHLNWGDAGIKQAFRRMYAQLRPGGKLILEPQNWAGYKKRKKLTETIFKNYHSIEFFPEKFREYLLSPAVGFAKGEILGHPLHRSKGFRRPIQVFTKSTMFPSERVEATPLAYSDRGIKTTEKYEQHNQTECVEHVYTDLLDNRYCGCTDDNAELNDQIGEELRQELRGRVPYTSYAEGDLGTATMRSEVVTSEDAEHIHTRLSGDMETEDIAESATVESAEARLSGNTDDVYDQLESISAKVDGVVEVDSEIRVARSDITTVDGGGGLVAGDNT